MKSPFSQNKSQLGFTLIELMVVVVIVALLAAIALPSYQLYIQRSHLAQAQQEMQKLAEQLERHKAKNFSYKGFDATYLYTGYAPSTGTLAIPVDGSDTKFTLTLLDLATKKPLSIQRGEDGSETTDSSSVRGLNWVIRVERAKTGTTLKQPRNYDLLLTSEGVRCQTRTPDMVSTYTCGTTNNENW